MPASPRLAVEPKMLEWACDRSGKTRDELRRDFPLDAWIAGETQPTTRQLQQFANATYTAFGQLFDAEPPSDMLPISDFRSATGAAIERPSPHLLETIEKCQFSQLWYRDHLLDAGAEPLPFVGAVDPRALPQDVAAQYATAAGFVKAREEASSWEDAFKGVCTTLRAMGVLVFISGMVGANTHRALDPDEFHGFALAEPVAPLIFVNGRDSKAAQMFTLAHEFAHLLLGDTGLDDLSVTSDPSSSREQWCDAVASRMWVPEEASLQFFQGSAPSEQEVSRFARRCKVSQLVLLRRLRAANLIELDEYQALYGRSYAHYRDRDRPAASTGLGGDFYKTLLARYGHDYTAAVVSDTLAGATSCTDMTALLGFKKLETLDRLASELGLAS